MEGFVFIKFSQFLQTFSGTPIPSPAEEESPTSTGGAGEFIL